MDNNTIVTHTPFLDANGGPDYLALGGYGLFIISELLPFIRKDKQNNGLIHTLVCILKGSRCMADKLLGVLEKNIENPPKSKESGEIDIEVV